MKCANTEIYKSLCSLVVLAAGLAATGCVGVAPSSDRGDTTADCREDGSETGSCITATAVALDASDFTIAVSPASATVLASSSTTFSVTTRALDNSPPSIALAVSGLPDGVTGVFTPPSVTAGGSASLTLNAALTASGTAAFTVTGASATLSHTASASVTVQPLIQLDNGVPVTGLSGRFRQQTLFAIDVPAGQDDLTVTLGGGIGNLDLYVRAGTPPTTTVFDCNRFFVGPNESCEFVNPAATTYYILINGESTYSGMSVVATFGRDPVPFIEAGVPIPDLTGSAASETFFKLAVPPGAGQAVFTLSGGVGDADLYVRAGLKPTITTFDCKSENFDNTETCAILNPVAGNYYVMVKGSSSGFGYGGATLLATIAADATPALGNNVPVTGLAGALGSQTFFRLDVPAGQSQVVFALSGGSGDADLYVRSGSRPTTSTFTCRSFRAGNNETCTIASPAAGPYYVLIQGFSAYAGATLVGHFP